MKNSPAPVITSNPSAPDDQMVDFNFKVPEEFRARARTQAMARRVTARVMMMAAMEEYFVNHPVRPIVIS